MGFGLRWFYREGPVYLSLTPRRHTTLRRVVLFPCPKDICGGKPAKGLHSVIHSLRVEVPTAYQAKGKTLEDPFCLVPRSLV